LLGFKGDPSPGAIAPIVRINPIANKNGKINFIFTLEEFITGARWCDFFQ
jgi:hypothetical protein